MKLNSLFVLPIMVVVIGFSSVCLNAQEKANPFATNIIGTLANKQMAAELDLLDEQKENIDQLMKDFGRVRKDIGQDMKPLWDVAGEAERKELGKEYWRRIEDGRLQIVEKMRAELLPHQLDRLEQLSAQRMMGEGKGRESAGLLSDQMIDYLNIDQAQKTRIEQRSEKLKKEVGEKIRKILEEAKEELLNELTADQKTKYEKLIGDPVAEKKETSKPGKRN